MEGELKDRSHAGRGIEHRAARHRHPGEMHHERIKHLTLGQRAADWTSGFAGSWTFILIYAGLTVAWCGLNVVAFVGHWDPYPFIFYTFSVSVLAILMSSLILLAGNRQADIDRAHAENAYHHVDEVNMKQDQQLQILHHQLELMEQQISTAIEQHSEILRQVGTVIDLCGAQTAGSDEGSSPAPAR